MADFAGASVLVTGAGSGIGAAISVALVKAGCANLILADVSESSLEQTAKSCSAAGTAGLKTFLLETDLKDESATKAMIDDAVKKCDGLIYFVNCAGSLPSYSGSQNISYEKFKEGAEAGQRAIWLSMREQLRHVMQQSEASNSPSHWRASMVNVASNQGLAAEPGFPSYSASSHAIVGMTRTSAMDYIRHGIRINCVCPGPTDTPELRNSDSKEDYLRNVPLQRMNTAEEVAAAVIFLLSPAASGIVGAALQVDSGWSLCHY